MSLIFGHPAGAPYLSGDAGWLSLVTSYGLLPVGFFAAIVAFSMSRAGVPTSNEVVCRQVCLVFIAFMLVNRIHDYWPIARVFYWHLGELIARKENRIELLHGAYSSHQENPTVAKDIDVGDPAVSPTH